MFVFVACLLYFKIFVLMITAWMKFVLMPRRKLPVNHSPLFRQTLVRGFTPSTHKVRWNASWMTLCSLTWLFAHFLQTLFCRNLSTKMLPLKFLVPADFKSHCMKCAHQKNESNDGRCDCWSKADAGVGWVKWPLGCSKGNPTIWKCAAIIWMPKQNNLPLEWSDQLEDCLQLIH